MAKKPVPKPKSRADAERAYHVSKAKRAGIKLSPHVEDKSTGKKLKRSGPTMVFVNPTNKKSVSEDGMLGSLEDHMAASKNPWDRNFDTNSPASRQFSKGRRLKGLKDSAKPGKFKFKGK